LRRRSNVVELIDRCLSLFEEARESREAYTVSEVSKKFSRGRGKGAERGKRYHRRVLQLDPYPAAYEDVWACPLPLAWQFRFGWLYGVVDQVVFVRGVPVRVVEYKSYRDARRSEEVQASLYGLLITLCFATRPDVYLYEYDRLKPLSNWEVTALIAISSFLSGRMRGNAVG